MKVWVVIGDNGLNGPVLLGVFGHKPTKVESDELGGNQCRYGYMVEEIEVEF